MYRDPYRRSARRVRRVGNRRRDPYPVLVFGPDDPVVSLVIAAVGRWLYRHRSGLAPFTVTGTVFATAVLLHARHSGWCVWVAVATTVAMVTLGFPTGFLRRMILRRTSAKSWWNVAGCGVVDILARIQGITGMTRRVEQVYAAAVVGVTGGWLSAGIVVGPTVRPLPVMALTATVVGGVPWWVHRRRRARVRVERTIAAWPSVADNMGLPESRLASVVVDAWGWTARVVLRKGSTLTQAVDRIPAIESALGLRPGSVRVLGDSTRADRVTLRVVERDPHAKPIPWPGIGTASITRPVDLGLFEDGRPVRVLLLRRHVLIGGMVGAGKSGIVNVILAVLSACADVVIWGVDLKGGMELHPWAACLARLASTPEQATTLFRDAVTELDRRAARMAARGLRVWEPTPDDPALVIVVDEYAEMPQDAHAAADSIARRGRAVAVNLLAATQRPTQDAMGHGAVRAQMDVRICLRVRERRDVDLILGQGSHAAGWHAHTLTQAGVFLIAAPEHTSPERARGYLLEDARIRRHAADCAPRRPPLGTDGPDGPSPTPQGPHGPAQGLPSVGHGEPPDVGSQGPDVALWRALRTAGPAGVKVVDLVTLTGKGRTWVYERLRDHANAGRAVQLTRGRWRATVPGTMGTGRPGPAGPGRGTRRARTTRRRVIRRPPTVTHGDDLWCVDRPLPRARLRAWGHVRTFVRTNGR